jgi:YD repeat-containing protein
MRTPLFAVTVLFGLFLQLIISLPATGETVTYTYDISGQLTKVEYPDGTVITYSYDMMGNRQSRVTSVTATAPPTVTTGSATGVTGFGAILNATVVANNLDTTVTFEYGLTTAYGTTVAASQNPVTGTISTAVSRTIIGLTTGAVYHYRAVAVNSKGTAYGIDKTFTATGTSYFMVVVGTAGTGNGTLSSSSPMIPCNGVFCSGVLMGSSAIISVTPAAGSYLNGWSGCDLVNGNNCTLLPTADKNVTATVDAYPVARVGTSTTYSLKIQDAFTAATSGDTIKTLAQGLTENLVFSNTATVSLKGGFTPGFTSNTGYTTLNGTLKISAGRLNVGKIVLKKN